MKRKLSIWLARVHRHDDTFVMGALGKDIAPFTTSWDDTGPKAKHPGFIYLKNEEIEPLIYRLRKLKRKIAAGEK